MSKAFFNVTPRKNLLVESISQDGARRGKAGVGGETGNKLRAQPPPSSLVCGDIRHVESEKSLNGENEAKLSKDEEKKCLEKFACWFSARKKASQTRKKKRKVRSSTSPSPSAPFDPFPLLLPASKVHSPLEIHRLPASCLSPALFFFSQGNAEIYLLRSLPFLSLRKPVPGAKSRKPETFSPHKTSDENKKPVWRSRRRAKNVYNFSSYTKRNLISLRRRGLRMM